MFWNAHFVLISSIPPKVNYLLQKKASRNVFHVSNIKIYLDGSNTLGKRWNNKLVSSHFHFSANNHFSCLSANAVRKAAKSAMLPTGTYFCHFYDHHTLACGDTAINVRFRSEQKVFRKELCAKTWFSRQWTLIKKVSFYCLSVIFSLLGRTKTSTIGSVCGCNNMFAVISAVSINRKNADFLLSHNNASWWVEWTYMHTVSSSSSTFLQKRLC